SINSSNKNINNPEQEQEQDHDHDHDHHFSSSSSFQDPDSSREMLAVSPTLVRCPSSASSSSSSSSSANNLLSLCHTPIPLPLISPPQDQIDGFLSLWSQQSPFLISVFPSSVSCAADVDCCGVVLPIPFEIVSECVDTLEKEYIR
ncbi:hypothetical protein ADUPG1_002432, partial [Aduncisulcus paluster]